MVLLQRKLYFSNDPKGVQHFSEAGVQLSPGGVQMLISIETNITCDFPYPPSGSSLYYVYGYFLED